MLAGQFYKTFSLFLLLFYSFLGLSHAQTSSDLNDHRAVVFNLEGDVQVLKAGTQQRLAVSEGMTIEAGDQILTKKNSTIEIAYDSLFLNIARIEADTLATFKSIEPTDLYLENGTIFNALDGLNGSSYQISTQISVAAVRGTHFDVSYDSGTQVMDVAVFPDAKPELSQVEIIPVQDGTAKMESFMIGEGSQSVLSPAGDAPAVEPIAEERLEKREETLNGMMADAKASGTEAIEENPDQENKDSSDSKPVDLPGGGNQGNSGSDSKDLEDGHDPLLQKENAEPMPMGAPGGIGLGNSPAVTPLMPLSDPKGMLAGEDFSVAGANQTKKDLTVEEPASLPEETKNEAAFPTSTADEGPGAHDSSSDLSDVNDMIDGVLDVHAPPVDASTSAPISEISQDKPNSAEKNESSENLAEGGTKLENADFNQLMQYLSVGGMKLEGRESADQLIPLADLGNVFDSLGFKPEDADKLSNIVETVMTKLDMSFSEVLDGPQVFAATEGSGMPLDVIMRTWEEPGKEGGHLEHGLPEGNLLFSGDPNVPFGDPNVPPEGSNIDYAGMLDNNEQLQQLFNQIDFEQIAPNLQDIIDQFRDLGGIGQELSIQLMDAILREHNPVYYDIILTFLESNLGFSEQQSILNDHNLVIERNGGIFVNVDGDVQNEHIQNLKYYYAADTQTVDAYYATIVDNNNSTVLQAAPAPGDELLADPGYYRIHTPDACKAGDADSLCQ